MSFVMQRYVIWDAIKHYWRSLKMKTMNGRQPLKLKSQKSVIVQLRKLRASKICTYTVNANKTLKNDSKVIVHLFQFKFKAKLFTLTAWSKATPTWFPVRWLFSQAKKFRYSLRKCKYSKYQLGDCFGLRHNGTQPCQLIGLFYLHV